MRASYSIRSSLSCKTRSDCPRDIEADYEESQPIEADYEGVQPHRLASLSSAEKARRVARLRNALQGAAPDFHARPRLDRGGDRQ